MKPLSTPIEHALIAAYQAGDRTAGVTLLRAHRPFIRSVAAKYQRTGVDTADLYQEADLAFLHAVTLWCADAGANLISYASLWMRAKLRKWADCAATDIYVPLWMRAKARGHGPRVEGETDEQRRGRVQRDRHEAERELWAVANLRRLDAPIVPDADEALVDCVSDHSRRPDSDVIGASLRGRMRNLVRDAMALLTPRERGVIHDRFLVAAPKTLEEIAIEQGCTRERIRQIEEVALKLLRYALDMDEWERFDDWLEHAKVITVAKRPTQRWLLDNVVVDASAREKNV